MGKDPAFCLPGRAGKWPQQSSGLGSPAAEPYGSGGWKSRIEVSSGLAPSGAWLLGLQVAAISL